MRNPWPVFLLSICACAQQAPAPDPRYASLAERLLAAADEGARRVLLDANAELANSKLATALMDAAGRRSTGETTSTRCRSTGSAPASRIRWAIGSAEEVLVQRRDFAGLPLPRG